MAQNYEAQNEEDAPIDGEVVFLPPELVASIRKSDKEPVQTLRFDAFRVAKEALADLNLKENLARLNRHPKLGGLALGSIGISLGVAAGAVTFGNRSR